MRKILAAAAAGLLLVGAATATPAWAAPGPNPQSDHSIQVCAAPRAGEAACHARQAADANGRPITNATAPPSTALTPTQLQDAYKLGGLKSGGRTVAIVDAYGYPNLERDLGVFRSQFGFSACTTSNGCLTVMNQNGGSKLPHFNTGWAQEQSLDVDAVSAACPDCKIVVVQANTASFTDLGTAVQTAAKLPGVVAISNSYGGSDAADSTYGKYYNFPGIAVTASAGDNGYKGGSYPASSSYVVAVGGTSLVKAPGTRGWSESVWNGTGSGCSTLNQPIPAASSYGTGCAGRAMNDVSAASDPSYGGLAVYYPTSSTNSTWGQFGGTSEASPIIASVYALSGSTGSAATGTYANSIPYGHSSSLFDVTSGSNGTCPTTQWCNARNGWDGPTGLGTPNGTGGF
ncbi:peptidase S8 [Sinomonas cellulolyticus]|uniref:S8 family serine peptidase n=1 Tax=Sinomonas cellulolyticus TaxID=2801916 RepID=A0ABS1JXV4_9MICC|nr:MULTISPECIES: S8 family serine peptidase [Sinomonas]MBL0704008.1 S8 family serine peptidase [Sinomonas cellulolyticus]GHG59175.1 peptidase S8 [Sinomonas sp. KCTC 49339]